MPTDTAPLSDEAIARIRMRAMYIADAERAAIRATDLLLETTDRDDSRLQMFLTVPRGDSWYAVFGKLDERGHFTPGYAFRALRAVPERMSGISLAELPEDFSPLARAVRAATERAAEVHGRRQLNPVVYEEEGRLTVYVMQGFHEPGLYLLGGDFRFEFSPDGRTLREEVALHQSIIPVDLREATPEGTFAAHSHTHVLVPGPVETEWALLMLYPELRALFVGTPGSRWSYELGPEGEAHTFDSQASEKKEAGPR
ncbi:hypothetical protein FGE12_25365 [Aggregicoccus sp. 17bor-14]|uniref:hypothetical protein n=1 Tax=Myxococcaceae TaxID=31 RepID=UPI00129D05C9|nr:MULTISPECIES: hypothetical protein [Myxococcaceae]MBF5045762.1 hypothetical protein [Simulacricoccus sp. 17bor-14]MRI91497.1 hypothetical protein [Aggregicoccus sp. 17bor-14]